MHPIDQFRQALSAGRVCLGASITFNDPLVSDALADSAAFLWIDTEHTALSPEALNAHLLAARARGVPALVRVPESSTAAIKQVLDAGADGVIVPQVRSVEEVRQVVSDCCYPPLGRRGFGPRVPTNYDRSGGREYLERANERVFIAVQIETAEALASLDAILAVPRVDSIVIGPWDLSGALGMLGEVEHPTVVAAIEEIIAKTRAAGRFVGCGMGPSPEYATVMARRGIQWIQLGCDYGYLVNHMDQMVAAVRRDLGDRIAPERRGAG